jgi:3-oxoadipate enol-lactonase
MTPEEPRANGRPTREHLIVPGGRLAYESLGEGPPVLFLHSAIADSRLWDRELPLYSARHQAIRFDQRGFGGSSPASAPFSFVEDIRALLTHLDVPKAYLVGSSMGGAFAIDFGLEHPDMVAGLFLVAPGLAGGIEPPFSKEEQTALEYDDQKSQAIAQAWKSGHGDRAFELLRELWCSALEGPSLELFRRMVEQNRAEVFDDRSAKLAASPPPAAGRLPTLRVPTTVLIGDRDNPSSEVFAKRISNAIPGAHLVPVRGADHLVNLSRPEAFDAALRTSLKGLR